MKPHLLKIIFLILLIAGFGCLKAQVSCSSGQSLIYLYNGHGRSAAINNASYVLNKDNGLGITDARYATVKSNLVAGNRGVLTIDLTDNVPNLDTISFVASGMDNNACTWDVSVSSDGATYSAVRSYTISSLIFSNFTYIVNNASGARYVRFTSTSTTKDLRVDAVGFNKKSCTAYCLSSSYTYVSGNAIAIPVSPVSTGLNPTRALGVPDQVNFSKIDGNAGNFIFVDLGTVVPQGGYIQLYLAQDVAGTAATFQVTGSADNLNYSSAQTFTSNVVQPNFTEFYFSVNFSTGARYLKIAVSNTVVGDVDAVTYLYPSYWGKDYITGTVFNDINSNGIKDVGETGTTGITVNITKDYNNNGIYDPGDDVIQTTNTTANGDYQFIISTIDSNYLISVLPKTLPVGNKLTTSNLQIAHMNSFNITDCANDFGYNTCGGNCKPVSADDQSVCIMGSSSYLNVLNNDYDPNNDLDLNSLEIITNPDKGSVLVENGVIIYTPVTTGPDTIEYIIGDLTSPTPLFDTAKVVLDVTSIVIDACANASLSHIYYIPAPEQDIRTGLGRADCHAYGGLSDSIRTILSIKCPYPGIYIYYDQWEDGYEPYLLDPVQSTTQVWGDGNPFNGVAPGYSNDIIPAGGSIILDNVMFANPRNSAQIKYDARDKLFSTAQIALSRISWDMLRTTLQAYSVDVYDESRFGTSFNIPLGKYSGSTRDFQYTALFIRAAYNNTDISIDLDNDGTVDVTHTLQEGENFYQDGGVFAGAAVTSSLPVGIDVFFGDTMQCFNAKELNVLPANFYGDTYYTPVPTTKASDSAVVMFYNPVNLPITINWLTNASSGSFVIGPKGIYRFPLGIRGYRFKSAGGESYVANELIDAWPAPPRDTIAGTSGGDYDWAFALQSEDNLTSFGAIAWAPGSTDGSVNGNPVWVMPVNATTVYVKWDGNVTGAGKFTSPCGLKYDVSYALSALTVQKLLDASDNDQSGVAVYDCNSVKLSMAYGEDPSLSTILWPYIDVGTSIQPFCVNKIIFANDDYAEAVINTPVTIPVLTNDNGFTAVVDPATVSTTGYLQPKNGTLVINSNGTIRYTPNNGFTGADTFVYRVCSTPSPVVCDWATVIVTVSGCPGGSKTNAIYGQVFLDVNKDSVNNDNTGYSPAKVYLYVDGNCNSTIDANEVVDSVTVDASGQYQFIPYPQKTVTDNFDGVGGVRTCNNGTDGNYAWLTNWTDAADPSTGYCNATQTAANTDVEIMKDGAFGNALRLKDNDVSAIRSVNTSGATAAYLSFSYRRKSTTFAATDTVKVQMSTNGVAYTTVYNITGTGVIDAAYLNVLNVSILPYVSATTYVRFLTGSSLTDADTVYIDNVSIKFHKYSQCYIVAIPATTAPAGYYMTTPIQYAFTAINAAVCFNKDFGLAKTSVTISGTLYNDANGLSDALVNGTAFDSPSGATMYVYLIENGIVAFKDTLNSGNGSYIFPRANAVTTYTVLVTTSNVSVGAPAPSVILPSKWGSVGETYGAVNSAGVGNESGTPNSTITVQTSTFNCTGVNFGIQQPAAGPDQSFCKSSGITSVTLAATTTPGTWEAQYDNPLPGNITSPTSPTSTVTGLTAGGIYHYIWVNGDVRDTVQITISAPDAGVDFSLCGGAAGSLNGNYAIGTWTARAGNPAGGTLGSTVNGVASVSFTKSSNGSFYYVYTVNGCADTIKITLYPAPVIGSVTSTLANCANAAGYLGQLTAPNPSPNTGLWSVVTGPGSISTPSNYSTVIGSLSKTGASTTVSWIVTATGSCNDTAFTTMTPPTLDSSMISKYSTSYCITCPVINGNTFSYYDLNGKLLASVTDSNDAVSIGQTDFCAKLNYPVAGDPAVGHVPSMDTWLLGVGHLPQPYLPRAWTVNTTTDAPMTINLYFTDAEIAALQGATLNNGNYYYFETALELNIAVYPNNSDTFIPAGAPNGQVIHPTFTRVNGYWQVSFRMAQSATFYLYPPYYQNAPLPVELVAFEATPLEKIITLDWSTVSEFNNIRFDIERSSNGINFENIGQVPGAGNYLGIRNYTFNDQHAVPGVLYYYRLRQVDLTGHATESKIKQAIINADGKLVISQFIENPAERNSIVRIMSNDNLDMSVKIFTSDGRLVREDVRNVPKGESELNVDISLLAKGTYIIQFNSLQGTEVRRLLKLER